MHNQSQESGRDESLTHEDASTFAERRQTSMTNFDSQPYYDGD